MQFKIFYRHYRKFNDCPNEFYTRNEFEKWEGGNSYPSKYSEAVLPRGGKTQATIEIKIDNGNEIIEKKAVGEAVCSDLDPFNRKTGRELAIRRALKEIKDKELVKELVRTKEMQKDLGINLKS